MCTTVCGACFTAMERRNSSDCLISRRNRYSAKKRKVEKHEIPSANARGLSGWIDNSFSNGAYHLESEHSVAELQLPVSTAVLSM